jgi:hypothetical protein
MHGSVQLIWQYILSTNSCLSVKIDDMELENNFFCLTQKTADQDFFSSGKCHEVQETE